MSDLLLSRGDLVLLDNDLALEANEETAVASSISRRLRSSSIEYNIVLIQDNELVTYDASYGADLRKYSSSPMYTALEALRQEVPVVLQQESRITLNSFNVQPYNEFSVQVNINYSYYNQVFTLEVVT